MARILYAFHPIMNGIFPYGGFSDDLPKRGNRAWIDNSRSTKPRPPQPKRPLLGKP